MTTQTTANGFEVKFISNATGNPPGKIADCEIHFTDGVLAGCKLIGWSLWQRRDGGRNVVMPSRACSVNGERRSFALVRAVSDQASVERVRDLILAAYAEHEIALAEAS